MSTNRSCAFCALIMLFGAAFAWSGSTHAGFDGFSILSSTFDNQYNGNEVWDGATFQNQWVQAGGGDPSELTLSGTNLIVNQQANNGWFEHDDGTTPFELGSGSWTVEVRAHVQATGTSGFNIWAALNGQRDILVVNEGSVTNLAGTEFDTTDNTDGFHDFRLVYDATDDVYHYFRDAVQLTPAAGVGQQAASPNTRLIIGDCCTGIGGIGSIVEYEYIRYDMDGAFSPAPDQGARTVTIDRDSGEISIQNTSGTSVSNIIGYSLLSAAAALDQTNWDKQSVGASQLANDDDDWTVLTGGGVSNDLSEAVLTTNGAGDGGDLVASTGFWTFGDVWRRGPFEDVVVELLLDDGTILDSTSDLVVTYVGNNDESFNFGDFDLDRDLDEADWATFKGLYRGTDLSAIGVPAEHQFELYEAGDLTGDGTYSLADFAAFEASYDAVNGPGAFAALTAVPEPASILLVVLGGTSFLCLRRGGTILNRNHCSALALAAIVFGLVGSQQAAALTPLDSSGFDNQYNGNEIWDGANFLNQWAQNGGATPASLSLNGTNLVQDNDANNGWVEHDNDSTPWELGSGSYTVEITTTLNDTDPAENDGFTIWTALGGSRQVIWIQDDSINTLAGDEIIGGLDNTDGLQTVRVAYDADDTTAGPEGTYHVWWNNVPITDAGIARQDATTSSRLIVGDCCTSIGNPVDEFEVGYIRYDMDGAFEPTVIASLELELQVNTDSGAVSIVNNGSPLDFDLNGYEIVSQSGSLLAGNWNSLEDQDLAADPTPGDKDNGDSWEEFDNVGSGFLGEGYLLGSSTLADPDSFALGSIWNTSAGDPVADLAFSYTTSSGAVFDGIIVPVLDETLVGGDQLLELQRTNPAGIANWQSTYGTVAPASAAASAVPEPGSGILLTIAAFVAGGCSRRRSYCHNSHASRRLFFGLVAVPLAAALTAGSVQATQNDRDYTLGDDSAEGAVAGNTVGSASGATTFDSAGTPGAGDLQDLFVAGGPTYVSVSDRPGAGVSDLGADFDGSDDALSTPISMNAPTQMYNNETFFPGPPPAIFPHNYEGIFSHGIQLWAKPDQSALGTTAQTLVRDTAEHGVAISESGNWSLLFDDGNFDSGVSVASTLDGNGWAHAMELSGFGSPVAGASAFAGALLVNGVAIEVRNTFYDPEASELVLGANVDGGGGFVDYYDGTLDDVRVFFWGDNSDELGQDGAVGGSNTDTETNNGLNADGQNWGPLNLNVDNDWIANRLADLAATAGVSSIPDTDLDFDGDTDGDDETLFIAGWRSQNLVDGVQIGDWNSRQDGDFNYDGIVNLADAFLIHEALPGGLNFAALEGVPEPSSVVLALAALLASAARRDRKG